MENWKPVVGYEGLYEVSDLGRVKSLNWQNRGFERCLYLKPHNKGYLQVELYKNNTAKMFMVHRLVALAFLPNPHNFPQVNHKDENRKNNAVCNLEWCDQSYNVRYSMERRETPQVVNNYSPKYQKRIDKKIVQLSLDGEPVKTWSNSREIFKETGMSDWSISECCRGNRNKAYGFKWQYAN